MAWSELAVSRVEWLPGRPNNSLALIELMLECIISGIRTAMGFMEGYFMPT